MFEDGHEEGGQVALVMEYGEGESLSGLMLRVWRGHPRPASNVGRTRHAQPVGAKHKPAAPGSCDPPYAYDREGVRRFKPWCL